MSRKMSKKEFKADAKTQQAKKLESGWKSYLSIQNSTIVDYKYDSQRAKLSHYKKMNDRHMQKMQTMRIVARVNHNKPRHSPDLNEVNSITRKSQDVTAIKSSQLYSSKLEPLVTTNPRGASRATSNVKKVRSKQG